MKAADLKSATSTMEDSNELESEREGERERESGGEESEPCKIECVQKALELEEFTASAMQFRSFLLAAAGCTAATCAPCFSMCFSPFTVAFLASFPTWFWDALGWFSLLHKSEVLALISIKPWVFSSRHGELLESLHGLAVQIVVVITVSARLSWLQTMQHCWSFGLVVFHLAYD